MAVPEDTTNDEKVVPMDTGDESSVDIGEGEKQHAVEMEEEEEEVEHHPQRSLHAAFESAKTQQSERPNLQVRWSIILPCSLLPECLHGVFTVLMNQVVIRVRPLAKGKESCIEVISDTRIRTSTTVSTAFKQVKLTGKGNCHS